TVTEPVVASVLGVTVLGETLGADGPQLIALAAAVAVVVVATAALARGEAASMAAGDQRQPADSRLPVAELDAASPEVVGATGRA
ncbi:MAG TPA: DMT family transporter, partial [Mycobacterium sp.]|nr:DMT family transporter [Mycobacterium sp.]